MDKRKQLRVIVAALLAIASCTLPNLEEEGDDPGSRSAAPLEACSDWNPTWKQGSGANEWWVEYSISGSVTSASLEVAGRANLPLALRSSKWSSSAPAKISRGATVVLHAQDSLGRAAETRSFRFLVDTVPLTGPCTTPPPPPPPPPPGDCWSPAWKQGSGANAWWVEYSIPGATSAALEVPGRADLTLALRATKWSSSTAKILSGTNVVLRARDGTGRDARTQSFRFLVDTTPATAACTTTPPPPPPPPGVPDTFAAGDVDVVSNVKTAEDRRPISPLLYGVNTIRLTGLPADLMRGVTFVRRGGDRANTYNWETNVSNGGRTNNYTSDYYLADTLAHPFAPGEVDRELLAQDRAAGRGTMVPFVLNDYVAAGTGGAFPWDQPGFNTDAYFHKVQVVKPFAFTTTPDLNDGVVYTDEHINFLKSSFATDVFAPGPGQLIVGSDNEPDLWAESLPFLQRGTGAPLLAPTTGVQVGRWVTGDDFTARFIRFAKRVKSLWPNAPVVAPDHYAYDGFATWWGSMLDRYADGGRWYMDDFLASTRQASEATGTRLLDYWDFHWYPQRVFNGTYAWMLDDSKRRMTQEEIDAVVQGPRSYWDTEYDENSWITNDHLFGPAYILTRLQSRIATGYPGTKIGVTEYFPGGCSHVSNALGVVDTLGVFGRMGVDMAAMWLHSCDLRFAYGGFKLVRNADGNGLQYDATAVRVEHPEKVASSLYAASDSAGRVTVLVVNKSNAPRIFGVRLFNAQRLTTVAAYRVDAAHADPFRALTSTLTKTNAYAYTAPAMSATLLVFRAQ